MTCTDWAEVARIGVSGVAIVALIGGIALVFILGGKRRE